MAVWTQVYDVQMYSYNIYIRCATCTPKAEACSKRRRLQRTRVKTVTNDVRLRTFHFRSPHVVKTLRRSQTKA